MAESAGNSLIPDWQRRQQLCCDWLEYARFTKPIIEIRARKTDESVKKDPS